MTLDELAIKHGTDKCSQHHNYTALYENVFGSVREEKLKILEIGIAEGASLRMWMDYFPNAEIHGIDTTLEAYEKAMVRNPDINPPLDSSRVHFHIGDQGDRKFMTSLGVDFDIVIDDGSHRMADQILSFQCLWPNTRLIYVIEDTYTSYLKRYGGAYRKSGTTVEFFKDLVDDTNTTRFHDKPTAGLPRTYNDIAMIQFAPALILLYKGNQNDREDKASCEKRDV